MKIRIGKDINIRWEILTDGEPRPLEGRTLALYIQDYTRRRTEIPFTIAGNALLVSLRAAQLTRLGEYVLTLVENEDEEGQTAVDAKPAFTLVEYTTEEDDSPAAPELDVEQVRLETANLVRTAGGILPEELFAGTPVVMEKGDIVPVMRDGQLRPVRVPGTLHGKYKGVIHKAVPLRPKRGMAYIFRDGLMFFKSEQSILREHLERLYNTFHGALYDISSYNVAVDEFDVHSSTMARRIYKAGYIFRHPEITMRNLVVFFPMGYRKDVVIFIDSDEELTGYDAFKFDMSVYINSNQIEMVSENYTIKSGLVQFIGMPYINDEYKLLCPNTMVMQFKRRRTFFEPNVHLYSSPAYRWVRMFMGNVKSIYSKLRGSQTYRLVRYETSFRSAKNPNFVEIKGAELIRRVIDIL